MYQKQKEAEYKVEKCETHVWGKMKGNTLNGAEKTK